MKKFSIFIVSVAALLLCGCEKVVVEYQYVDLGLSVKWAKVNVGAKSMTDTGDYFAWGEVAAKEDYSEDTYKWIGKDGKLTKYCSNESYEHPDNLVELERADDAASVIWGEEWRTPTYAEIMELVKKCTWTWSQIDGVRGYKVSSKVPGYEDKFIFLPAAGSYMDEDKPETNYDGCYWSSTNCGGSNSRQSNALNFNFSKVLNDGFTDGISRTVGAVIRPVHN